MQISVVNLSKHLAGEHVREVVHAVNRQVKDDFAPHWCLSATLSLSESPCGDAVLYLDDDPRASSVDGYHSSRAQELPFGVVYTKVAEKLDGAWSITFSHEALELIADPIMNKLAEGPHPVERVHHVFHWFEVCDPVQTSTYRIDGIAVSNFVLPAYFNPSPHVAGRRDFRGVHDVGPFGIAPGGYVTFFDPRLGKSESVDADQEASRRRRLKAEHALLRGARRGARSRDR